MFLNWQWFHEKCGHWKTFKGHTRYWYFLNGNDFTKKYRHMKLLLKYTYIEGHLFIDVFKMLMISFKKYRHENVDTKNSY